MPSSTGCWVVRCVPQGQAEADGHESVRHLLRVGHAGVDERARLDL